MKFLYIGSMFKSHSYLVNSDEKDENDAKWDDNCN